MRIKKIVSAMLAVFCNSPLERGGRAVRTGCVMIIYLFQME
jgi:hypothetical protein